MPCNKYRNCSIVGIIHCNGLLCSLILFAFLIVVLYMNIPKFEYMTVFMYCERVVFMALEG